MTSDERHQARYERRKAARELKRQKYSEMDDFDKVFTYDNMYNAYKRCICGKKWKASVQRYIVNAPKNISETLNLLHSGKYKLGKYYKFTLTERGKARYIQSVCIKDRVVQRCLCDNLLIPVITKSFIYDNGACLKNKGIDFTRRRIKQHLTRHIKKYGPEGYVLMIDFKKYFESLDHDIVKKILRKYITDIRVLRLLDEFVDSFDKGLGLGSQMSYLFALMIANEIDREVKEQLKVKYYGRYMDDCYLICDSKESLREYLNVIESVCSGLGVTINRNKTHIFKLSRGFTFLKRKYSVLETGKILIRCSRANIVRARRKLKKFALKIANGVFTLDDLWQSFQCSVNALRGCQCYRSILSLGALYNSILFNFENITA